MQKINSRLPRLAAVVALAAGVLLLAGCERPPVDTSQQGFRGTGMQNTVNPRIAAKDAAARPTPPEDAPPRPPSAARLCPLTVLSAWSASTS